MEIKRFFANIQDFDGRSITIYGEEFLHMTKALRHKVGYKIIVSLDDGKDYYCSLAQIGKDFARADVEKTVENECKTKVGVTLFQALPKGDKLDLITQKCVELGVERIVPFLSRYTTENKFNRARLERIALEACKQCGRSRKAEIGELVEFDQVLEMFRDFDLVIMPYERATSGSLGDIKQLENAKSIALIIGSEGGFCEQEVQKVQGVGGRIVSLGKRILRCETASIVGVGIVMYLLGELGGDRVIGRFL